ncbi:MAG: LysM peptidoglycan-binding domain-containing protein [Chloroflexi bacterium]|nr:LysM peptidoglycan-binding domain-containing protein [Chloroflexota bacterium]
MATRSWVTATCAVVTLCLGAACGGAGGAATPTSTVVPVSAVSPAPVASPQRPPLASPVASPSSSSVSAAPTTAAADATGDSYAVQSGDTLLTIADHFYGDNTQWRRIYDANKDVIGADPDKLKIGMTLKIPPKQ